MTAPPLRRVRWSRAFRLIPSRYPPIALFERLGDPSEWEALAEIESLTNPRIRDLIGEIALVPPEERVAGPGASFVMASFTHLGRPSRFSDGSYGVYYAARLLATAIAESAWHMARFYRATGEPPAGVDMRILESAIDAVFHDLRGGDARFVACHDPESWAASQELGRTLRRAGSHGVAYASVRHPGGECLAAFRPRVAGSPAEIGFLLYHFDGEKVDRVFDYARDAWFEPAPGAGP